MEVHHKGHHAAYTAKANEVLTALGKDDFTRPLVNLPLTELLQHLDRVPEEYRATLQNHGGGFVNHDLFWRLLAPPAKPNATEDAVGGLVDDCALSTAVQETFGSLFAFRDAFKAAALKVFGSGWVWLVADTTQAGAPLRIMTTPNQDSPWMTPGLAPVVALDVWEHAYYLQYKQQRGTYVEAFWHLLNFREANRLYEAALATAAAAAAREEL